MTSMPDPKRSVVGGVDTHADTHVAAALDQLGKVLGVAGFPATPVGYRDLIGWLRTHGDVTRVGVEGTGSWGKGLTRVLTGNGIDVVEVIRPNRQTRRRYGKNDQVDAIAAARSVINGEASAVPRDSDGPLESLRVLRNVRRSAVKERTRTINQIRAVITTAPDCIRNQFTGHTITRIVTTAARFRPGEPTTTVAATKYALKTLSQRHQSLTTEIKHLDTRLDTLVASVAPAGLLEICGVATNTATDLLIAAGTNPHRLTSDAAFAALCGVSPIDASSGRQQRHRLNRGGDRQANAALYRIAIVQLRYHQPARDYMTKRLAQGRTKRETIRSLKRHIARQIWRNLPTRHL